MSTSSANGDGAKKALIIGGGIAGPVTAMALQRAGIHPVVYEAYPSGAGTVGAFLTVAVNGLDALGALDLHEPVMAAGFPTRSIEFLSGSGKRLGELPIGGTLPDGTVTHTIKRADLYRVLRDEATRRGIQTEHGKRLVAAEPTPDGGVVARFEDGTEARGDLSDRGRRDTLAHPPHPRPGGSQAPVYGVGQHRRVHQRRRGRRRAWYVPDGLWQAGVLRLPGQSIR